MDALLTIDNLKTYFYLDEGIVRAVDGVDLAIARGETLALVGESGCGKSITAYSILQLIDPPGRIVEGMVTLHREDGPVRLNDLPADGKTMRAVRGKDIAIIFQEPMTALSPVHTVGSQIMEAITLHTALGRRAAREHALLVMDQVGIPDTIRRFRQYPHEMSGGLRQRAVIAMALVCQPKLLIADEPTTALDVTLQAQVLNLLTLRQRSTGMAMLLITHDLGVVAQMAQRVAVMYLGRIVEQAEVATLFSAPQHPYTQALLRSIPARAARNTALTTITGNIPDPLAQLPGCPFAPRCTEAVAGQCDRGARPTLRDIAPGHAVACFRREKGARP